MTCLTVFGDFDQRFERCSLPSSSSSFLLNILFQRNDLESHHHRLLEGNDFVFQSPLVMFLKSSHERLLSNFHERNTSEKYFPLDSSFTLSR